MQLKETFNEDPSKYDQYRPTYVTQLFHDIIDYSKIHNQSKALEIGVGTGQATRPLLEVGCHVTGVELGTDLAEFTKQKFLDYNNFQMVNANFEHYQDDKKYDLIYSATAFHWIPSDFGISKVLEMLKPNGTVALFWTHPCSNHPKDPLHKCINSIYQKYLPLEDTSAYSDNFDGSGCQRYCDTLQVYGFKHVIYKLYKTTRHYSADEYIGLLNTYSNHRILDETIKLKLEDEIREAIVRSGDSMTIYDTIDLYLARK